MTMSWSLFLVTLLATFLAGATAAGWYTMHVIFRHLDGYVLVRREIADAAGRQENP